MLLGGWVTALFCFSPGQKPLTLCAAAILPYKVSRIARAHVQVRDLLTSATEQAAKQRGGRAAVSSSLRSDAVSVEAIVNTIGFPLVGGPAGKKSYACM